MNLVEDDERNVGQSEKPGIDVIHDDLRGGADDSLGPSGAPGLRRLLARHDVHFVLPNVAVRNDELAVLVRQHPGWCQEEAFSRSSISCKLGQNE